MLFISYGSQQEHCIIERPLYPLIFSTPYAMMLTFSLQMVKSIILNIYFAFL